MKNKICDCYHTQTLNYYLFNSITGERIAHEREAGVCYGTRECEPCKCGGDKTKCDFYKEKEE